MKKAFEKTLAITKVGLECELKMSKLAQQHNDAHTCFFLSCCAEQKVTLLHLVIATMMWSYITSPWSLETHISALPDAPLDLICNHQC